MADIVIHESDADGTIQVARDDVVIVELEESIGTGYSWEVAGAVRRGVEVVGSTHVPAAHAMPGAAGTRRVRLAAREAGTAEVELVLRRPWEDADAVIRRLVLRFSIL